MIDELYRAEWGRLLSLLVARTRRLDLAEDALAEAFARAAERWPREGAPNNPAGWLYTTAHRQLIGRVRAEAVAGRNAARLVTRADWSPPDDPTSEWADDRLGLILLCCHPALRRESQSALALRLVIGTPTDDIATLFLVSTTTMAARITRAKKKIVGAGIPLASPLEDELESRLDEVCRTIYLAFTAGYTPRSGADLLRADLAGDAIRLAELLRQLVPDAPQVRALLALLVLQHSRRDARERDHQLITLNNQDRRLWRTDEIRTGLALVDGIEPSSGYSEELRLQALIAAEHGRAQTALATDWPRIATLYGELEALTGSSVVRMNRAVAVGEAVSPSEGLALLVGLDEHLVESYRLASVRADLARRSGAFDLARESYRLAIARCPNRVERSYLEHRLRTLDDSAPEVAACDELPDRRAHDRDEVDDLVDE